MNWLAEKLTCGIYKEREAGRQLFRTKQNSEYPNYLLLFEFIQSINIISFKELENMGERIYFP